MKRKLKSSHVPLFPSLFRVVRKKTIPGYFSHKYALWILNMPNNLHWGFKPLVHKGKPKQNVVGVARSKKQLINGALWVDVVF